MNELENKKQFKCIWVGPKMKEEKELILYPNKGGTVADLLEEAKKQVEFSEGGTGKLRLTEINCNKVTLGPKEDTLLESLNPTNAKTYRIEEIPKDEQHLQDDETLVSCAHFHKEVFSTFGIPFLIKIKHGETFGKVKGLVVFCLLFLFLFTILYTSERIQKKLAVPDKEWEKFKFAVVVVGRPQYINDDEQIINIADFKPNPNQRKYPFRNKKKFRR